ncbi:MarR family transcriptional regulator [Vibrio sp. MACH09]|uniref:MarR family winged helix-turn-helix transcriptional regulator n=1 Tax=unclassified Vibrio TaxID=2614977 RepID=UPI0014936705|nr:MULTISPECIES: MarR family transcriptional regulator [unclassified Vibrio]NOI64817.1 MarR family transcriptional regulator [Vibrio sp. 99-8-1]GLO61755.1 MarR family transcriptional regulator [Vibrio sp. MACH09]
MSLQESLIKLERFMSKEWRLLSKVDDPLAMLSFNEFDYLKVIQYANEPIRITDLAEEMLVAKPSASNMVVRLEKKGLVKRIACPEDARAKRVILTEKAQRGLLLEDVVHTEITRKLEAKVSKEEVAEFVAIFNKMLK